MSAVVKKLDELNELLTIDEEWERLNKEIELSTPFTSPRWIRLWWKHFRRDGLWTKDEPFVLTVRDDMGALLAVVPMMVVNRPGFGPVKLRMLRFFGADTSLTEVRGVICRRSDESVVFRALCDFLHVRKKNWDLVEWTGIWSDGDAKAVLETGGPPCLKKSTPMYIMQLPNSWKDLVTSLSSNMRKNVRRAYEVLQSTGHNFEFRVIQRPCDVGDALDRFFRLHSQRAQAPDMLVHPDKFKALQNRAFITECITEIAKRDGLRIFEICIGGDVVASRLSFYLNESLYFYYAGYDPSWRHSSVMTILMAEALKWAMERGVKLVNLSAGKDLSKLRWKPKEISFESFVQFSSTPRARYLGGGYILAYLTVKKYSSLRLRELARAVWERPGASAMRLAARPRRRWTRGSGCR